VRTAISAVRDLSNNALTVSERAAGVVARVRDQGSAQAQPRADGVVAPTGQ
jgi:hypothetical protein